MSVSQIAALVIAAVLVFWMVGAYNRLVGLRGAIASAWQQVNDVLTKRGDAAHALVLALRAPLADEQGSLDALVAAETAVRAAADALGQRPLAAPLAAALVGAEAAMASASARVLGLLALHDAVRADPAVAPHAAVLADSQPRLVFARQLFNDAAQGYNLAARQFPTRLVTRVFGFGSAGSI